MEVLRTFVSEHGRPRPGRGHRRPSHSTERVATDVQAAIDMLLRLPGHPGLPKVQLDYAHLPQARLKGANLSRAQLVKADLTDANLDGATLSSANLATAKNLTQQQLDRARGDEDTKLPAGLQRPAHGRLPAA